MGKNVVTSCYGVERFWDDRDWAIKHFETAVTYSSGEELDRNRRILKGLRNNKDYVTDSELFEALSPAQHFCCSCGSAIMSPNWADTCICCGKKWQLTPMMKTER